MYKTIILDIDGTILDSEKVLLLSFQKSLKETIGLEKNLKELELIIGMEENNAAKLFTDNNLNQKKITTNWSNNVIEFKNFANLFPYVEDTLKNLKHNGIKLGIATSKKDLHMKNEFNHLGINHYFDVIITIDNVKNPKPHPESLELAIRKMNSKKSETLFIGDSIFDLKCAENAGVDFALASWGAKPDERLYKSLIILNSFKDILYYIK